MSENNASAIVHGTIKTLKSFNLSTFYLVPLINGTMNLFSFGLHETEINFVNCFINQDDKLVVQVKSLYHVPSYILGDWASDVQFVDSKCYIVFDPNIRLARAIEVYKTGKYSTLDYSTKQIIKKHSGLDWRLHRDKSKEYVYCDPILLALDKDQVFKELLEEEFEVKLKDEELLQRPRDKDYIQLKSP